MLNQRNNAVNKVTNVDGTTVGTPTITTIATGSLTGSGQSIGPFDGSNYRQCYFSVTGTFNLTFTLEASFDSGATWVSWYYHNANLGTTGWQTSNAGSGTRYSEFISSPVLFRVRCSAYTSGTAAVTIYGCGSATFPTLGNTYALCSGYIASGASDNATLNNPLKNGGLANSAIPTAVSNGQIINGYYDLVGRSAVFQAFKATNVSSATTTTPSGAKFLHAIVVNSTAAGTITVYDNTAASGTKIATLKSSIVEGTYVYNSVLVTGLTVVTAAASDISIIWG